MVMDDLKEGKFVIEDGVVSTLTPFTTLDKIEKELRKEVEANMTKSSGKEIVLKSLGSALEFFTENGWKIYNNMDEKDCFSFYIAAPFEGRKMRGKSTAENKVIEIYVPKGYLYMKIDIYTFPIIDGRISILPNVDNLSIRDMCKAQKYGNAYFGLHPHSMDNQTLCCGINLPYKYDLNIIVATIEACIKGSKSEKGSSIFDYNEADPATDIYYCKKGKETLKLHNKGKSDDEIWREILKIK